MRQRSARLGSLLVRMVVGVLAIIAVMAAMMFFAIDHLVSIQFRRLHGERVAQYAEEVRHLVDREMRILGNTASLIAQDSNLNHSAQYHLYLRGEGRALHEDIERISNTFELDALMLSSAAGQQVAGQGIPLPHPSPLRSGARAEWIFGRLWLVAAAPLYHRDEVLAVLQIGRPLDPLLTSLSLFGPDAGIRLIANGDAPAMGSIRIPVNAVNRDDLVLEVVVPTLVDSALAKTKDVLSVTLALMSLFLAGAVAAYLHRQLRPLGELTMIAPTAAVAVRNGEALQVGVGGHGEVADLIVAFNAMMRDLADFSRREKELRHREQLTAIGQVATQVAHDINNPLTVIKNAAILLRCDETDPERREDFDMIVRHSERCHRTVDNLLRFGRPLRLACETVELNTFLRSYFERRSHVRPSFPYVLRPCDRDLVVSIDTHQVEQMLDNLLDNASEANGGENVDVSIEVAPGNELLVRIVDHGPGFDATAQAKAFDFYYTSKPTGTGLGLPNALAIARAHGGDIAIGDAAMGEVIVRLPHSPPG